MSKNKLVQLLNQYDHQHTVAETGKVLNIKPITTGQMKSILQYEGNDDPMLVDKVLDDLIDGCVVTEGFNVDELTIQDRFELLIAIRKISKGSVYNFNIKCPECGVESIQAVNLNDLEVVPYPVDIDKNNKIQINNNLFVELGYIRRGHQKQSVDLAKAMGELNDSQLMSEIATFMYAFGMVQFSTKQGPLAEFDVQERKEFLDNLSAESYDIINDWYDKNDYGTKFVYKLKCKAGDGCTFEKEEDIPMTGFFF